MAVTGKASNAVHTITSGLTAYQATGATLFMPQHLTNLARARSELGQFGDAWRFIGEAIEAIEKTKERWWEAEVNRLAGEIALKSLEPDASPPSSSTSSDASWDCCRRTTAWERPPSS